MSDAAPAELSPERVARREKIKELTNRGEELYAALQANAAERDALILLEMQEPGVIAKDIAEFTGLTVNRIYKLRDNGAKRAEEG